MDSQRRIPMDEHSRLHLQIDDEIHITLSLRKMGCLSATPNWQKFITLVSKGDGCNINLIMDSEDAKGMARTILATLAKQKKEDEKYRQLYGPD